jgi:hypothetical protein
MWKNIVEPDGPQMTKWRKRIDCWIPKASTTHSEYVTLTDFYTATIVTRKRLNVTSQRTLPDNTQHSKETDIHDPGEIRARNPSKRAAAYPRLGPRGHKDRHSHSS